MVRVPPVALLVVWLLGVAEVGVDTFRSFDQEDAICEYSFGTLLIEGEKSVALSVHVGEEFVARRQDVEVFEESFAWIARREIFEDGNMGTGRYEDAVVSLAAGDSAAHA